MPAYKNSFRSPEHIEATIVDGTGSVVGKIRIKPSGILWKPSGAHKYYSVPWTKFADWIVSKAASAKTTTK